jgi:hypothetical protein
MDYRDNKEFYQSRETLRNAADYTHERYQSNSNVKKGIITSFFAVLSFVLITFLVNVLAAAVTQPEEPSFKFPELPKPISSPSHTN